jgi:hypothetical protein
MRRTFLSIIAVLVAIICLGMYGKLVLWGQAETPLASGQFGWARPMISVGVAYFLIGVAVPVAWLYLRGEAGEWSVIGTVWSLIAGVAASFGTLGVLVAFSYGGEPVSVMPVVFGGTAVVNSFLTIHFGRRHREINSWFLAGAIMVVLGAIVALAFPPVTGTPISPGGSYDWLWWLVGAALAIAGWGAVGPTLYRGRAAMQGSVFRPLFCIGLACLGVAVFLPGLWLAGATGQGVYTASGTLWSMIGGASGAVGLLGIVLAYYLGTRPVYVLPVVFFGAPIVNMLFSVSYVLELDWPLFLAGMILLLAGSIIVLVIAKRGEEAIPVMAPAPAAAPPKPSTWAGEVPRAAGWAEDEWQPASRQTPEAPEETHGAQPEKEEAPVEKAAAKEEEIEARQQESEARQQQEDSREEKIDAAHHKQEARLPQREVQEEGQDVQEQSQTAKQKRESEPSEDQS